jgi:23S rRNA (pseudouridine1915-N3)-methyltransferase
MSCTADPLVRVGRPDPQTHVQKTPAWAPNAVRRPPFKHMKTYLYYIGRAKDPHANAIAEDFAERAARFSTTEMREIRPERIDLWSKHPSARKILLDPSGEELDSAAFTALVAKAEREGRDLVFVVGGHDGLPAGWAARADLRLSLSPLTFPHELARAVLAEQIYRAFATLRGHPYPR